MSKYRMRSSGKIQFIGWLFLILVVTLLFWLFLCSWAGVSFANSHIQISKALLDVPIIDIKPKLDEIEREQKEKQEELAEPLYIRTANVPTGIDTSFKSYMDYTTITDYTSRQWELQQNAYTDEYGLRKVGEYYCVALGTGIAEGIGTRYEIALDSGVIFKAILADQKADIHTDASNRYVEMHDGGANVVEFIVDTNLMDSSALQMGDVSYTTHDLFRGNIVSIKEIGERS